MCARAARPVWLLAHTFMQVPLTGQARFGHVLTLDYGLYRSQALSLRSGRSIERPGHPKTCD